MQFYDAYITINPLTNILKCEWNTGSTW